MSSSSPTRTTMLIAGITLAAALTPASSLSATSTVTVKMAAVSSTGVLDLTRSYGATSAIRQAQGKYKITFASSITTCAVSTASGAASTSINGLTWNTRIATLISGSYLYITAMGENNGPKDYPFSVLLACRPPTAGVPAAPITPVPVPGSTSKQPIRFATVSSTGVLDARRSYGATSAMRAAQDKYKITFSASIKRCAVSTASLAGTTSINGLTWNTPLATLVAGSYLYVTAMGENNGPKDYPFSVVLACA